MSLNNAARDKDGVYQMHRTLQQTRKKKAQDTFEMWEVQMLGHKRWL